MKKTNKKAEMSITMIITIVIAIVILLIVIFLVSSRGRNLDTATKCSSIGGVCGNCITELPAATPDMCAPNTKCCNPLQTIR